jgi:hypothetical protein
MSLTLEPVTIPESGPFSLELKLATNIQITAERAWRKVGVYVGDYIADLLSGETPSLVWKRNKAYWRVPVVLTGGRKGRIGIASTIDVETGELQVNDKVIQQIEVNAERLAISNAL